jgi:hypothetical protein
LNNALLRVACFSRTAARSSKRQGEIFPAYDKGSDDQMMMLIDSVIIGMLNIRFIVKTGVRWPIPVRWTLY